MHSSGAPPGRCAGTDPRWRAGAVADRVHTLTGAANVRVLVVEDSERLRRSVGQALQRSGYAVDATGDGPEGLWLAQSNAYDVIVLDLMLPGLDGLSIVGALREAGNNVHVLLLTAKDTVADRVQGLQRGADDYLVKPFALEELLARVQTLCRRAYGVKQPRIAVGDLEIDTITKEVFRRSQPIRLKPREYALLEYLALRAGEVVSRPDIESHIYADDDNPMSNVVDSAISVLRKRLAVSGGAPIIHTRHGLGYILKMDTE
jgi:DNA-binding response OmpR family regulator